MVRTLWSRRGACTYSVGGFRDDPEGPSTGARSRLSPRPGEQISGLNHCPYVMVSFLRVSRAAAILGVTPSRVGRGSSPTRYQRGAAGSPVS
jgi:hypothetical protein